MKKITSEHINSFSAIVGKNSISVKKIDLDTHSKDSSFHNASLPDVVIWPKSTLEVSNTLKLANIHQIPVTAWGGGSSLEGNPIPVKGGIILNMTRMNKVLKVYPKDLQVRVQPGIIGDELDRQLRAFGLWFAAAPGSKHLATIGGMIANNAGGMHAVKYGAVGDAVLELEVVLANGDIIRVGSRSHKSVSGYDLKSLFIASGGTLGIITEAVLRLTPLPQTKIAVLASFPNNEITSNTSLDLLKSGILPASIEFMDSIYLGLINKAKGTKLMEQPTLLIELHGNKKTVAMQISQIKDICKKNKSTSCQEFKTKEKLRQLWEYRRSVRPKLSTLLPNTGVLSAEVGVPVSQIPKLLKKAKDVSIKYQLQTVTFGHMGDGNFHAWALYELNNKNAWVRVTKLNEDLINFAIKLGGTITGEHGIGIGKKKFLPIEHATTIHIMKSIKKLLDPSSILNPGKILPD